MMMKGGILRALNHLSTGPGILELASRLFCSEASGTLYPDSSLQVCHVLHGLFVLCPALRNVISQCPTYPITQVRICTHLPCSDHATHLNKNQCYSNRKKTSKKLIKKCINLELQFHILWYLLCLNNVIISQGPQ